LRDNRTSTEHTVTSPKFSRYIRLNYQYSIWKLEYGPMANVIAALKRKTRIVFVWVVYCTFINKHYR